MTFSPILDAGLPVQIHLFCVLLALMMGPFVLLRPSRDRLHRRLGALWVGAMGLGALSSFLIRGYGLIGPFSPIHLLSLFVLWSLWVAIAAIRRGDVKRHRAHMQALYVYALLVPGLFTLLPGRVLHRVIFGTDSPMGFATLAMLAVAVVLGWWLAKRKGPHFPLHKRAQTR